VQGVWRPKPYPISQFLFITLVLILFLI